MVFKIKEFADFYFGHCIRFEKKMHKIDDYRNVILVLFHILGFFCLCREIEILSHKSALFPLILASTVCFFSNATKYYDIIKKV